MNTKEVMHHAQARLDDLVEMASSDPILGNLTNPSELKGYLQAGFSAMLKAALLKERTVFLDNQPDDRANGFAPTRTLHVGATPVTVDRPRTRDGFYPAFLPKHQRHIPEDYQELLEQILVGAKSFESALRTMHQMGLGYSRKEVEALLGEMEKEAAIFHSRPLAADWLVLYLDAKVLDLKDEHQQVKKCVHFTVIGVDFEARKQVLCAKTFWGNETVDCWRDVFKDLKNRGVSRLLLMVTDDFSGITKLVKGFWPQADHQLCTVHLLRNAHRQLSPQDYKIFQEAWTEIIAASSADSARTKWLELLTKLRAEYPAWVEHLQARTDHYLHFMSYPAMIRRNLRSTNLPEGINNLIEILRRNAGGHFHTQRELDIKMKILIDQLHQRKWAKPNTLIAHQRSSLIHMFKQKYENELPNDHFLTQKF
jgi:transposase-like protein